MFFDSHCHLNFECFNNYREHLMEKLLNVKVSHILIPGTDVKRWFDIIQLVDDSNEKEGNNELYFALGIHPHFLNDFEDKQLLLLQELLKSEIIKADKRCVALGEIGLDKMINIDPTLQEKVFCAQLNIAQSLQLPVILHVVKRQSKVLALLKQVNFAYGGVYHAFSGSEEIANEFIKLGFKLGVGGVITHPSAHKTRKTLSTVPLTSLVLETDAPDMPIYQQLTRDNSPINLPIIFKALCDIRDESPDTLEQQLYLNTNSLFSIIHD